MFTALCITTGLASGGAKEYKSRLFVRLLAFGSSQQKCIEYRPTAKPKPLYAMA